VLPDGNDKTVASAEVTGAAMLEKEIIENTTNTNVLTIDSILENIFFIKFLSCFH
jgi:hypothetical protein